MNSNASQDSVVSIFNKYKPIRIKLYWPNIVIDTYIYDALSHALGCDKSFVNTVVCIYICLNVLLLPKSGVLKFRPTANVNNIV